MNDLEKELIKRSDNKVNRQEELVSDVKLLLETNAKEEIETLKHIGLDADIRFAERQIEDILIRDKGKELYDRHIVHRSEINKLCLDYRLYMRHASQYAGRIPADLGAELTRFCKEKGIALGAHPSTNKFFIVAPPKMFKGYKSPLKVMTTSFIDVNAEIEERRRLKREDPILVYQMENPEYFAVIKSWGNDFNTLRRVYGFFTKRNVLMTMNFLWACLLMWSLWTIAARQTKTFMAMDVGKESSWWLCGLLIDIGILGLAGSYLFGDLFVKTRQAIIKTVTKENEG